MVGSHSAFLVVSSAPTLQHTSAAALNWSQSCCDSNRDLACRCSLSAIMLHVSATLDIVPASHSSVTASQHHIQEGMHLSKVTL